MNLLSFVDELVKVGAMRCLYKGAADLDMAGAPEGLMSSAAAPPGLRVFPDEVATRVRNAHLPSIISVGQFGKVTPSSRPIDQEKYDRRYVHR